MNTYLKPVAMHVESSDGSVENSIVFVKMPEKKIDFERIARLESRERRGRTRTFMDYVKGAMHNHWYNFRRHISLDEY